jgi:hypothetical protein
MSVTLGLMLLSSCVPYPSGGGGGGGFGGFDGDNDDGPTGGGGGPVVPCTGAGCPSKIAAHFVATAPTNPSFLGNSLVEIAAGGTLDVRVQVPGATSFSYVDDTQPYQASAQDPTTLSVVKTEGAVVTVLGKTGTGALNIDDGDALRMGTAPFLIAPIAAVHAAPVEEVITTLPYHDVAAAPLAFPVGAAKLAIALIDDSAPRSHRLIDTSLVVTGATRTGWDTVALPDAAPGHHAVTVRTGDGRVTVLDVVVVTGPDRMVMLDDNPTFVCFGALAQDAFVAGLAWTYTLDGVAVTHEGPGPNCLDKHGHGRLTATAGGVSSTITIY